MPEKSRVGGLDCIRDQNINEFRFAKNPAADPEKEFKDVVGVYSNIDLLVEEIIY